MKNINKVLLYLVNPKLMKKLIFILLIAFSSCSKESITPVVPKKEYFVQIVSSQALADANGLTGVCLYIIKPVDPYEVLPTDRFEDTCGKYIAATQVKIWL